ncbi:hypothetical protein [Streptomyces phaeolivaceus]|uniref:hypothetical protein n=1 Tax=Streptomyces phaeolivaceus TaxID=2653200 RepID=UPI001869910C|nr:hypothetical protein [Streptomyces phaeolivaceus]
MGIDEQVCPVCGQPVATVVRRHKTLGTWVPVWSPGPCRNHECAAYVDPAVEAEEAAAEKPRAVARRTHGTHHTHGGHDVPVAKADTQVAEVTAETAATAEASGAAGTVKPGETAGARGEERRVERPGASA